MTTILYVAGDLLNSDEKIIVHGCNSRGQFGSGLALTIRNNMPWVHEVYRDSFRTNGLPMGSVVWAIHKSDKPIVGNAITQQFYGRDGKQYVSYDAIRSCLQEVNRFVETTQGDDPDLRLASIGVIHQVGFPLIGAGLGGGKWSVISKIIEEESRCFTPVVYLLDGVVPED